MSSPLEMQLCPRRKESPLAVHAAGQTDYWENGNRWGSREGDIWPEGIDTPPRTCTFCGGVHPEDALRLLNAGWEPGLTNKFYKLYIEPPGHGLHMKMVMESIGDDEKMQEAQEHPHYPTPVPPVKFYSQHATPEQIDQINELIKRESQRRITQ